MNNRSRHLKSSNAIIHNKLEWSLFSVMIQFYYYQTFPFHLHINFMSLWHIHGKQREKRFALFIKHSQVHMTCNKGNNNTPSLNITMKLTHTTDINMNFSPCKYLCWLSHETLAIWIWFTTCWVSYSPTTECEVSCCAGYSYQTVTFQPWSGQCLIVFTGLNSTLILWSHIASSLCLRNQGHKIIITMTNVTVL